MNGDLAMYTFILGMFPFTSITALIDTNAIINVFCCVYFVFYI